MSGRRVIIQDTKTHQLWTGLGWTWREHRAKAYASTAEARLDLPLADRHHTPRICAAEVKAPRFRDFMDGLLGRDGVQL